MLSLNASKLVGLMALIVVVGLLWALDHTRSDNVRQADRITWLESTATHDAAVIEQQATALANQQAFTAQLDQITATTAQLQRRLDQQSDALTAGLEELKRTDPDARDYLLSPVPAVVGMRHARPETTDPAAYREAAAGVSRADPVSAARSPSPSS